MSPVSPVLHTVETVSNITIQLLAEYLLSILVVIKCYMMSYVTNEMLRGDNPFCIHVYKECLVPIIISYILTMCRYLYLKNTYNTCEYYLQYMFCYPSEKHENILNERKWSHRQLCIILKHYFKSVFLRKPIKLMLHKYFIDCFWFWRTLIFNGFIAAHKS